ncbi:hypothetical protein B0T17DRAFT_29776 [Bombardia bombarda]|uniref:Uncharacterized protein n=1 Tax=Bombardia bombarda TaxID=252184 RepID=A0AA40CE37_9PEZI|nr:hypothetical protein B0T17DRAFT_29776 [Bombardia bombarda]
MFDHWSNSKKERTLTQGQAKKSVIKKVRRSSHARLTDIENMHMHTCGWLVTTGKELHMTVQRQANCTYISRDYGAARDNNEKHRRRVTNRDRLMCVCSQTDTIATNGRPSWSASQNAAREKKQTTNARTSAHLQKRKDRRIQGDSIQQQTAIAKDAEKSGLGFTMQSAKSPKVIEKNRSVSLCLLAFVFCVSLSNCYHRLRRRHCRFVVVGVACCWVVHRHRRGEGP